SPDTLNPGLASTITATVTDGVNPVVGETVNFNISTNASGGSLSVLSAITNVNGRASVTFTAGSTSGGADIITGSVASDTTVKNDVSVTVDAAAVVVGSMTLTSGAGQLVADGAKKATIRATVLDTAGNPAPNIAVDFETSLGTLTGGGGTASVTTDNSGIAELTLTAGTTVGTATITADASGFVRSIDVTLVAGTPTSVTVSPAPGTVNPDGASTITADIADSNGNPVIGETVNFAFDTNASGAALSALSAVTNVNGQAAITYTAGGTDGTDKITSVAASNGIAAVTPASVVVSAQAQVMGGISLIAGSASIVADGAGQVTIRATVTDINGDPLVSKTVKFETTAGTLSAATNDTDTDGNAEILLTAPESTGTVTVRAITDGFAQTVDINAIAGPADHFIYYVAPQTVNPGGSFHIDAWLEDDHDNRLTSQFVTFLIRKHSDSTIVETRGDTTAADNVVREDFTALWGEEDLDVTLESTNGKTAAFTVTVDAAATVVGSVSLSSGAASIVADSNHDTVIRATVIDSSGAAASGVTVDFATTLGTLTGGGQTASGTTDDTGVVEITLTSGTTTGTAMVTATASGFVSTTDVTFVAGAPAGVAINTAPGTVNPAGTSTITARVTDISGNPIVGETVGFYLDPALNNSGGALSAASAVTNINGVANVTFTAGDDTGTDTIGATAQSNGTSSTKDITVSTQSQVTGSVTVIAGAASLPADESSSTTIRATVADTGGNPVSGVTVNFTTTTGTLSAATDITDSNGIAEVSLTAPANTGTGTVTAEYNGFIGTAGITFSAGSADHIILYATPDKVLPGGAFQIAAIVLDAKDNRLSNERVTIIITENGGTDILDTMEQVTDADGVLRLDAAAAYGSNDLDITAQTSNGTSKTVTVDVDPTAVVVGSVSLTSGATTLVANGSTTIIVRATVTDTSGAPTEGVNVAFETTAGTITAGPVATNSSGIAEATLTSSTNAGTANITAVASGFRTSITVTFIAGAPETVSVAATPGNLTADGTSTSTINIIVKDANGNPVNGETLTISVDEGTLNSLVATTVNGLASATYTSPNSVPADGRGTITVETANGKSGTADITLIGQQIASITLSASPTSLPADGSSQSVISATLTLVGGGAVPDGTTVDFTITDLDGNGNDQITPQASTSSGVALATLISDDIQGTAVIQATAGGRTAQIQIEYTPGSISLLVVPNSILGTGDKTADITVTVLDAAGAPLNNETVNVALDDLSLGTVSPASSTTGVDGKATFQFTGAAKGGMVTITASYDPDIPDNPANSNDVSGTATIDIQEPPAFIEVADGYPDPTSINIKGTGGQSTSQLIFDVKDIAGNPVADGYRVDFEILSGPNGNEAIEPSTTTTSGGQIATILRSGTKSGPVSIKVTYYNNTNISTTTSQIAINAGPPVGEEFGIFAQFLNVSGLWVADLQEQVSVNVGDIYGNAVPDETAISFKTYNTGGFFSPNTAATTGGLASNTLHSGGTSPQPLNGFLSVTAEANNGGRTTHVTSIDVNPDDNNILYIGTDGGGVYKSTDAGASWSNVSRSSSFVSRNFIDPYVNGISLDPDDPNVVYAATGYLGGGHVYRSKDGGGSWNSNDPEEWNGLLSVGSSVQTVLCDDGGPYVWAGTNGMGALFAADGENFQWGGTSTTPVAGANVGNGVMSTPTLGLTAVTEDWSATYAKNGADTSTPVFTGAANGTMSGVSATSAAKNEDWTVSYTGGASAVTYDNAGGGTATADDLTVVSTYIGTLSEGWTVTCTDDTAGSEKFLVIGSKSGVQDNQAEINKNYIATGQNGNVVKFFITGTGFAVDDNFTFSTMADGWSVTGTGSGSQTAARTGVAYTSDSSEISFTIVEPTGLFYETGDKFEFTTIITGEWIVAGTVSGAQSNRAENGVTYTSDNEEVSFAITQGTTPFEPGDSFTFSTTGSGLGYGKLVRRIVKAAGTGDTATLYAATATGVYKTTNGGQVWSIVSDFTGDNIQALVVHPNHSSVIYAGTADNGIYYSDDSGNSWNQVVTTGLGQGISATDPSTDSNNTGNGVMSAVEVFPGYADTLTENWTVTCKTAAADGGTFTVTGSVSGPQADYDITSGTYTIPGVLSFTITDGSTDFAVDDTFTFSTTRDPGMNIKDLLVYDDGTGYYLYAVTYFTGELEPHAVGNIYDLALDGATGAPLGGASWSDANTGLPAYDPPGDETLFAQHALAIDNPGTPTALFVGGEGINFYKATGAPNLTAGTPSWLESKSGLTNTIMARMPILFSGACNMNIYKEERTGDVVTYTVYIQDSNGNPPIKDSNFNVIRKIGDKATTLVDITYSDGYTHTGTWSDPSDPDTNNPYVFSTIVDTDVQVIFTFTPTCSTDAPGCSGGTQTSTLTY
ncbi:MAG: hypothetical protein GXP53_06245, partial [Deltaproteobacteria bacterium]|nr:hypothetical protein [Deltaproteobacteria bacterium]